MCKLPSFQVKPLIPANLVRHHSLGKIHCVGNGQHDQARMAAHGPVEQLVHDGVFGCDKLVELVY